MRPGLSDVHSLINTGYVHRATVLSSLLFVNISNLLTCTDTSKIIRNNVTWSEIRVTSVNNSFESCFSLLVVYLYSNTT